MGTCGQNLEYNDPSKGWEKELDLSSFTNKDPYFVIRIDECPKCKVNNPSYTLNQASIRIDDKGNIIQMCHYCTFEWVSNQKYHEQLELW